MHLLQKDNETELEMIERLRQEVEQLDAQISMITGKRDFLSFEIWRITKDRSLKDAECNTE